MEFLNSSPMMIAQDLQMTEFHGCLSIHEEYFPISISLKEPGIIKGASVSGDSRLNYLLRDYQQVLTQLTHHSTCLASFLKELTRLLERVCDKSNGKFKSSNTDCCAQLLQDIAQVGWDRLLSIDDMFSKLSLAFEDDGGRSHILKMELAKGFPTKAPKCDTDLPRSFDFTWNNKCNSIRCLFDQFKEEVAKYQDMWDQLEELDRNTWVLEPEGESYGVNYRRIALGNNASLHISVNPLHPRSFPDVNFLGPETVICPLKENLNSSVQDWDERSPLLSNLECVLSVKFPTKSDMTKEEVQTECGICYSYRLDGLLPHRTCDNLSCGQVFHQNCLYEWLRALPDTRQSFNAVFGDCPYCNKPTSVKMPAK